MPKKISTTPSSPSPSWNSGEYYKVIRLRAGDLLLCMMDYDVKSIAAETQLTLIRPVHIVFNKEQTETEDGKGVLLTGYKYKMWMDTSSTKEFVIEANMVLTMGDMSVRIKYEYQEYLKIMDEAEYKVAHKADELQKDAALTALLLELSQTGTVEFVEQYKDGIILTEEIDDEEIRALCEEQRFLERARDSQEGCETGEAQEGRETES